MMANIGMVLTGYSPAAHVGRCANVEKNRQRKGQAPMTEATLTLGQAIDKLVEALTPLDRPVRETALRAACAHLGIDLGRQVATRPESPPPPPPPPHTGSTTGPEATRKPSHMTTDIRSLREFKAPQSAKQMACIVGYYLQEVAPEHERKATVSTTDIEKYFKQAGFALPKKIEQVLLDAKRSGYFETAARGEYRLNAVGYNLAVHKLPMTAKSA